MSAGDRLAPAAASVLICSRERPAMLVETVRSILTGQVVPRELVVVDQSAARNIEVAALGEVRGCRVRYLHSNTTGLSRARNEALRAASSEVAVMVDDDMFVEDDWLERLLDGLAARPGSVATGRVLPAPAEPGSAGTVPAAALVERDTPAVYRGPQPIDVVPGANVALPRELVLELGGYDERLGAGTRFSAADDNDMGHRLLLAGCEVRHVPSAVVLHRAWRTRGELVRLRWGYGRGKGAFYAKHASRRDPAIARRAMADAWRRLRQGAVNAVRAPRAAAGDFVYLAGLLAGSLDWLVFVRIPTRLRRLAG